MRFHSPTDGTPLEENAAGELVTAAGEAFPVLAGVPVLVPAPDAFLAQHRESTLAALAEYDRVTPAVRERLHAAARRAPGLAPERFARDWAPPDAALGVAPAGSLAERLRALVGAARAAPDLLAEPGPAGARVLEVGPGAGDRARTLARGAARYIALDRSLPALLRTGAEVPGATLVLAEATALPLADASVDLAVAANVVDLLDHPFAFLEELARVLSPGGELRLSTPDPGLGTGDDGALAALLEATEAFEGPALADGIVWPRVHGPRELQLAVLQRLVVRRRA
ncbi:MAG: class I SAM-dependent methyltransferase [Myxococcota bacterium]